MKSVTRAAVMLSASVIAVSIAGCASEFAEDPNRPRATRAVRSTADRGDALSETMREPPSGVSGLSVLTIDFPNDKNDTAHVRTILDPLVNATAPAASRPSTAPAKPTVVEQPVERAANAVRVTAQQRPADSFVLSTDKDGNTLLRITCPSGIGTVTLERTGDVWPAVIHVTLVYGERPFTMLEGFKAAEVLAGDGSVELKSSGEKGTGKVDVMIPGFTRSQKITLQWVDAYR